MSQVDHSKDDGALVFRTTTRFPEPIADLVGRWSAMRFQPRAELAAFYMLLDAMERVNSLLAMMAVIEYVRAQAPKAQLYSPDADHDVVLLRRGDGLGWGRWIHTRRNCLQAFEQRQGHLFCRELFALRRDHPALRMADDACDLRNHTRGHGLTLDASAATQLHDRWAGALIELLRSVAFLEDYALVRVVRREDVTGGQGSVVLIVEERTGSGSRHPVYGVRVAPHGPAPEVGHLALLRRTAVPAPVGADPGTREAHPVISLHPLLVWMPGVRPDDPTMEDEVGLYQSRARGGAVVYLGVRSAREHEAVVEGFDTALQRDASLERARLGSWRIDVGEAGGHLAAEGRQVLVLEILRAVQVDTDRAVERMTAEGVYVPTAFVERARVRERVRQFLDTAAREGEVKAGCARLLLVTGAAGAGKSSFLCRLAEELRETWPLVPLVFRTAAELEAGRHPYGEQIVGALGLSEVPLSRVTAALRSPLGGLPSLEDPHSSGFLVFLVDSIDRTDAPDAVLRGLHKLVDGDTRVVVVATIAHTVLEGLGLGERADLPRLARFSSHGEVEVAVPIGELDDRDAEVAWDRYRQLPGHQVRGEFRALDPMLQAALRSPLLLRLTTEAFDGQEVPRGTTEIDVLARHARERVFADVPCRDFVRRIVRRMAQGEDGPRRRLPMVELLDDPDLRPAVVDPHGPLTQLLREQVLVRVPLRGVGHYDPPEDVVEFAFDAQLGYLLFVMGGPRPDSRTANAWDRVAAFARWAHAVAPLAFSIDLVLRTDYLQREEHEDPSVRPDYLRCVRVLLDHHDDVGADAVARFLAWCDARRPFRVQDLSRAISPHSVVRAIPVAIEVELRDALRQYRGDVGRSVEDSEPVVREEPAAKEVMDHILRSAISRTRLRAVAERLARAGHPVAAGYLAHGLLRRSHAPSGRDEVHARLLVAQALLRDGSATALELAREALVGAIDRATQIHERAGHDEGVRLLAQLELERGEFANAKAAVGGLFEDATRPVWDSAKHTLDRLLQVEIELGCGVKRSQDAEDREAKPETQAGEQLRKLAALPALEPLATAWLSELLGRTVSEDAFPVLDDLAVETLGEEPRLEVTGGGMDPTERDQARARWEKRVADARRRQTCVRLLRAAAEAYQTLGRSDRVARVCALLAERQYRWGVAYDQAIADGARARRLALASGAMSTWIEAARWEGSALRKRDLSPESIQASQRLALEATERALALGRPRPLADALAVLAGGASDGLRHQSAARLGALEVSLWEHLLAAGHDVREKLAYALGNLSDYLATVGRIRGAVEAGRAAMRHGRGTGEAGWAAVFFARAAAEALGVGDTCVQAIEVEHALDEAGARLDDRIDGNFFGQLVRAEALRGVVRREPSMALARVARLAEVSCPDRDPAGQLGWAQHDLWVSMLTARTDPAEAQARLDGAKSALRRQSAWYLVAWVEHLIRLGRFEGEGKAVWLERAASCAERARQEARAEFEEILGRVEEEGEASRDPARDQERDDLLAGSLLLRMVLGGREPAALPGEAAAVEVPPQNARLRRRAPSRAARGAEDTDG